MLEYREAFDTFMGVKKYPNTHEKYLFQRAQKYIAKLSWIPGIEMIAVVNSLSMYATHEDSDIDLCIVTKPWMMWLVRFYVTLTFWLLWVWRKWIDIRENFCLSFFLTTDAMDLSRIALEDDIYLYYWIYHMKPILVRGGIYERFLDANAWVEIDPIQDEKNRKYLSIQLRAKQDTYLLYPISYLLSTCIRFFLLPKTLRKYRALGSPEWVIISDNMLKFHDQDARTQIRDKILKKNFDK